MGILLIFSRFLFFILCENALFHLLQGLVDQSLSCLKEVKIMEFYRLLLLFSHLFVVPHCSTPCHTAAGVDVGAYALIHAFFVIQNGVVYHHDLFLDVVIEVNGY